MFNPFSQFCHRFSYYIGSILIIIGILFLFKFENVFRFKLMLFLLLINLIILPFLAYLVYLICLLIGLISIKILEFILLFIFLILSLIGFTFLLIYFYKCYFQNALNYNCDFNARILVLFCLIIIESFLLYTAFGFLFDVFNIGSSLLFVVL